MHDFSRFIRDIPDFPKAGIIFKDVTPLIGNANAFHRVLDEFALRYKSERIDVVTGIEARGFIFGTALAYRFGALVLSRSEKKANCLTIRTKPLIILNTGVIRLKSIETRFRNTVGSCYVMIS